MPFTTSHPAIVLPLKQIRPQWFSLTGLTAGALAPDLIYFLMMTTEYRGVSHSWTGLFIFCLPAGIAFSFIFHRLFKYDFIASLPKPFDRVLSGLAGSRFKPAGYRAWTILIVSILIGTLSHFFLDSMTHQQGEIARRIPFLLKPSSILGIKISNCRILQHSFTILGAVTMLFYIFKSMIIPSPLSGFTARNARNKLLFWIKGGAIAFLFACLVIYIFYGYSIFNLDGAFFAHPVSSTFGLAGWAGFFYYVSIYRLMKKQVERSVFI
jgi:hypothetical protein